MYSIQKLTCFTYILFLCFGGCAPRHQFHDIHRVEPNVIYDVTNSISNDPYVTPEIKSVTGHSIHHIQFGDTVLGIAKLYDVHPFEVIMLNKLNDPHNIKVGQTLKIPISYE